MKLLNCSKLAYHTIYRAYLHLSDYCTIWKRSVVKTRYSELTLRSRERLDRLSLLSLDYPTSLFVQQWIGSPCIVICKIEFEAAKGPVEIRDRNDQNSTTRLNDC